MGWFSSDEEENQEEEDPCRINFGDLAAILEGSQDYKCAIIEEKINCLAEKKEEYDQHLLTLNKHEIVVKALVGTYWNYRPNQLDRYTSTGIDLNNVNIAEIPFYADQGDNSIQNLQDVFDLYQQFYSPVLSENTFSTSNRSDRLRRITQESVDLYVTFSRINKFARSVTTDFPDSSYDQDVLDEIKEASDKLLQITNPILTGDSAAECASYLSELHLFLLKPSNYPESSEAFLDQLGVTREEYEAAKSALESIAEGRAEDVAVSYSGVGFQTLKEQCVFLSQIYYLVDHHKKEEEKRKSEGTYIYPYAGSNTANNAAIIIEDHPFGFINRLTQYPTTANFFDATNAQLAHLQPMIRLFKITPSNSDLETINEFPFDTFASSEDVRSLLVSKNRRGFGAGIKSFNFSYDGSNPFSIKKSIKASLTIYANNFNELLRDRGDRIRYIDLALKTGTAIRQRTGDPELDFRIKAVVGLANPRGNTTAEFYKIRQAVKENYVTLNLTPVTHTFDFDETGAVTFKIEYYAYIEEFLDNPRMNIFTHPLISKRVIERRLAYKTAQATCKTDEEVENLNQILEIDSEKIERDKKESLKILVQNMFDNNLIYFLSLTSEQIRQLAIKGPFYTSEEQSKAQIIDPSATSVTAATVAGDLEASMTNYFNEAGDQQGGEIDVSFRLSGLESNQYAFFYLGDLINLILSKIPENLQELQTLGTEYRPQGQSASIKIDEEILDKEKRILKVAQQKFEKLRFVLGPLEIVDHTNKKNIRRVSFADLPISLAYFNEWMTSKLLAKEEAEYPLTQFLNDIMNNFVKNYLNDDTCFSYNIKQRVRVFQNSLTSYGDDKNDNITNYLERKNFTRLSLFLENHSELTRPILQPAGPSGFDVCYYDPDKEYHFFIYYAGRVSPSDIMNGERCSDEEMGVFHYTLGKDRGIVKSIKLEKDESPGLKEVRFEQEGFDGLRQLREIYNINIETVANVSTFPGTYIFVEPRGFSPDLGAYSLEDFDLTDLGIGGYYMIIKSNHEFAAGVMKTNFNARWVQGLDSSNLEDLGETAGDGRSTPAKCAVTVVN